MGEIDEILELELTSRCALACPRCPRTTQKGSYAVTELPLSLVRERINRASLPKVRRLVLSGNYGDPIYHSDLGGILAHLKQEGFIIHLETNGSGRSVEWWQEIASVLTRQDSLTFSIDGLADTNPIYRIGSDWDSVVGGVSACREKVRLVWKFIVFRHNQHQVAELEAQARQLGFDRYVVVKSTRFAPLSKPDELRPDPEFIGDRHLAGSAQRILPRCRSARLFYVSAEGFLLPCCWIGHASSLSHPLLSQSLRKLSLHKHSLGECLAAIPWDDFAEVWQSIASAPPACQSSCGDYPAVRTGSRSNSDRAEFKLRAT